ncbi:MAG: hypothetical protein JW763_06995 [candidate division Zixibacteria bacterium]|nr:hypothetical protein [candidate division Zixibacteria bacterium]
MGDTSVKTTAQMSDLDILQDLRNLLFDAITKNEKQPKVGDLLKVIELKRKLSVAGKSEQDFWNMIDSLRKRELPGKTENDHKAKSKKSEM